VKVLEDPYTEEDFEQIADDVSKRQFWRRRPKRAADLVSQLMARKGYAQQESNEQLDQIWSKVAGERMASKTRVGKIHRRALEVTVENSAAVQQLTFQKTALIKKLKSELPDQTIDEIRFRVGVIR